ncbi:RES family NAD+ phosphorylase [Blastopirellula retiformator]|uniref:RES domain protein n=1 Tax=Blastopirellula retiformator TaxID=2527970 RepID=A0A5C5VLK4_9BACT|nr:RES family NAD+ phosphorylase [Blastopirellula retiformator]TWT38871.1 RES domain protein [Blastopirellula retiformator]
MSTHSESPEVLQLFGTIKKLLPDAHSIDATLYRSVGTRYANTTDFLSGFGASHFGGRWNRRGILAVYGSLDAITATHEEYQAFLDYGLPGSSVRPRVMAGIQAKLRNVLDLTSTTTRRRIGFSLRELVEEDWQSLQSQGEESWTQAIGRGSRLAGFEAIRVPSARNKQGANLVVFPDQLHPGSSLQILRPDEFPPHPSKWPT